MDPKSDIDPEPSGTRDAAWPYVLAGFLLASTQLADSRRPFTEREIRERAPFGALDPASTDPDRMDVRALRRLPAIGPTRAYAIARARWEAGLTGGPEAWDAIPGIGPETVRTIRSAIDESGKRP